MDQAQAVAEICAVIVAVVAAIFIGFQARVLARQARIANDVSTVQAMRELSASLQRVNLLFVEKPEIRPFFYEGLAVPTDPEIKQQVSALAEVIADYLETSLYTEEHFLDFANENRSDLRSWISFLQRNSPTFLRVVDDSPGWWPRLTKVLRLEC